MTNSKLDIHAALGDARKMFDLTQTKQITIEEARAELHKAKRATDRDTAFWFHGEIGDRATAVSTDNKVLIRLRRCELQMKRFGFPYYEPWLRQLCLWHKVKGGPVKTLTLVYKYMVLEDSMRKGLDWTEVMDAMAEEVVKGAVQAHKRKAGS